MSQGITSRDPTLGILNPAAGLKRFELRRYAPAPDLAGFVDWHWIASWSLPEPFEQEILPHPCVNLSLEARGSAVNGIGTRRSVARLEGTGRVVATKLKPGGFFPFARVPMRRFVDRIVPLFEAFGDAAATLEGGVLGEPDDAVALAAVEAFLNA